MLAPLSGIRNVRERTLGQKKFTGKKKNLENYVIKFARLDKRKYMKRI